MNAVNIAPKNDFLNKFYDPLISDSLETWESSPQNCKKIVAFQNSDVDLVDQANDLNKINEVCLKTAS
jgi:hypothetical protein